MTTSDAPERMTLEAAAREAVDLLAGRKQGSAARSPGHNARLVLEAALATCAPSLAPGVREIEAAARAFHDGPLGLEVAFDPKSKEGEWCIEAVMTILAALEPQPLAAGGEAPGDALLAAEMFRMTMEWRHGADGDDVFADMTEAAAAEIDRRLHAGPEDEGAQRWDQADPLPAPSAGETVKEGGDHD